MLNLYLDESGEGCFEATSIYKHLLITVIYTNEFEGQKIKSKLKSCFADTFYNQGWQKIKEIKAATVFNDRKFGVNAINNVLNCLIKINSLKINYIAINKEGIKSESLKKAPYGIVYNYFSGLLMEKLIFEKKLYSTNLIFDRRNKETHENKPFKEYLKTHILGVALEKHIDPISFLLTPDDSQNSFGLKAVDFCSWAIFRKYEYKDERFYAIIKDKIDIISDWYI